LYLCLPCSEGRVREKAPEVAPVQNRQAAQKLLDRRTDAGVGTERGRGRGRGFRRGGGRHDFDEQDERVMTLDEWEAKKSTPTPSSSHSAVVSDEELALRLQEQFNMEDSHVSTVNSGEQSIICLFRLLNGCHYIFSY
jgi:hypothetical protein